MTVHTILFEYEDIEVEDEQSRGHRLLALHWMRRFADLAFGVCNDSAYIAAHVVEIGGALLGALLVAAAITITAVFDYID